MAADQTECFLYEARNAHDDALSAAQSIGSLKFYDTLEEVQGDLADLTEGDLVEISVNGEHSGARARRRFLAVALLLAVNLD